MLSDEPPSKDVRRPDSRATTRRSVIAAGALSAVGLAGCVHGSSEDSADGTQTGITDTTDVVATPHRQGGIEGGDGFGSAFLADNGDLNYYSHHYQAQYAPEAETTFHVYQATDAGGDEVVESLSDGDAYAVAFDHAERRVLGPSRVGFNPLSPGDTHGVPALTIDGEGYIHVVFGSHGGYATQASEPGLRYARSADPYHIDAWVHPPSGESESGPLPAPDGTYPCPAYNPGEGAVYVLYRAGIGGADTAYPSHVYATLARSDDNGESWTDVNEGVLDFSDAPGDHYDAYVKALGAWAGRLHLTWTIAEGDRHDLARRNVYHAAYNPETGNMETTSGDDLGRRVTWEDAIGPCLVKETGETVIGGAYRPPGDSARGFDHAYDPASDTAYIPCSYGLNDETSVTRLYSYEGVSDGSGEWVESAEMVRQSPPSPHAQIRINEAGQPEVQKPSADGTPGVWVQQEDGAFAHTDWDVDPGLVHPQGARRNELRVKRVQHGLDEFAWTTAKRVDPGTEQGDRLLQIHALGEGLAGSATYPRPPGTLRVTNQSDGTVTIDWDEGIAGPAMLDRYTVYVDGEPRAEFADPVNDALPYPRTFANLDLEPGDHTLWVTLTNRDGTESGQSNVVTVSV